VERVGKKREFCSLRQSGGSSENFKVALVEEKIQRASSTLESIEKHRNL